VDTSIEECLGDGIVRIIRRHDRDYIDAVVGRGGEKVGERRRNLSQVNVVDAVPDREDSG